MAADIAPMPTKEIVSPVPVLNPWTFSAANLANEFMAVPGPADDLLERHPVPDERHDLGIDILAPQIASILQPFRSEQRHRTACDRVRQDMVERTISVHENLLATAANVFKLRHEQLEIAEWQGEQKPIAGPL
jgi:hypothetical protein